MILSNMDSTMTIHWDQTGWCLGRYWTCTPKTCVIGKVKRERLEFIIDNWECRWSTGCLLNTSEECKERLDAELSDEWTTDWFKNVSTDVNIMDIQSPDECTTDCDWKGTCVPIDDSRLE